MSDWYSLMSCPATPYAILEETANCKWHCLCDNANCSSNNASIYIKASIYMLSIEFRADSLPCKQAGTRCCCSSAAFITKHCIGMTNHTSMTKNPIRAGKGAKSASMSTNIKTQSEWSYKWDASWWVNYSSHNAQKLIPAWLCTVQASKRAFAYSNRNIIVYIYTCCLMHV